MSQNYATIFGNHMLFTTKQNVITFGLSKFQLPSSKSMGNIYVAESPLECLIPEFKSPQIGGVEIRSGDILLSKNKIIDNQLNLENNASNYLGATVYQNESPVGMIQKGGSLLSTALISSLLLTGCQLIDLEQEFNLETVQESTSELPKSNEWIFASPELHPNDDCVTEDKMFKADNPKPMELIGQLLTESSETAKQIKNVIIEQDKQMCQEYDNKFENRLMELFNNRLLTLEENIYKKSQELLNDLSNKDGILANMERSYVKNKQHGGMSLLQPVLLLTAASALSGCLSMETYDEIKPVEETEEINQNIFQIMHKNLKKIDLEFIEQFKIKEKQLNSNNKTLGVINNQLNDTILLNQSDQILNQMLVELERYKLKQLTELLQDHKNDIKELEAEYKEKRKHCVGFKSEKTLAGIIVATD